jgi:hypothetical protein
MLQGTYQRKHKGPFVIWNVTCYHMIFDLSWWIESNNSIWNFHNMYIGSNGSILCNDGNLILIDFHYQMRHKFIPSNCLLEIHIICSFSLFLLLFHKYAYTSHLLSHLLASFSCGRFRTFHSRDEFITNYSEYVPYKPIPPCLVGELSLRTRWHPSLLRLKPLFLAT